MEWKYELMLEKVLWDQQIYEFKLWNQIIFCNATLFYSDLFSMPLMGGKNFGIKEKIN